MDQQDYHHYPGLVFKVKHGVAIAGETENEITWYFRHNGKEQWKRLFANFPVVHIKRLFCTLQPADIAPLIEKAKQRDPGYQDPELLSYFILSYHSTHMAQSILAQLEAIDEVEMAYLRGNLSGASEPVKKKWLFMGKAT